MTNTTSDIEILADLENARYAAAINADPEGFRKLSHPAMTYAHSDGRRDTLDEYCAKLVSGALDYHWIDHPITEVIVEGDTAVVIGEMRADLTVSGARKAIDNTCVAVWAKSDDGAWRLLAYQPTPKIAPRETK